MDSKEKIELQWLEFLVLPEFHPFLEVVLWHALLDGANFLEQPSVDKAPELHPCLKEDFLDALFH